jgi:hypothetical protein
MLEYDSTTYGAEICGLYGEDGIKLLLLETVALNYPVIRCAGGGFKRPILVQVESGYEVENVVRLLTGYGIPKVLSIDSPKKTIRSSLQDIPYSVVIYTFAVGRTTRDNLNILDEYCGVIADESDNALVIVISDSPVLDEYADYFSGSLYIKGCGKRIHINEESEAEFLDSEINYICENTSFYTNRDCEYSNEEEELVTFELAAEILRACIGSEKLIDQAIGVIQNEWSYGSDPSIWLNLFCDQLEKHAEQLLGICHSQRVPGAWVDRIDECILYDETAYYISDKLFRRVCAPLSKNVSINYIKSMLSIYGALTTVGQKAVHRTVSVPIVTEYGYIKCTRMVKLKKTKIDRVGRLPIQDLMKMNGETPYEV